MMLATSAFDRDILQWFAAHRGAPWTGAADALMDLGTSPKPIAAVAVGALLLAAVLRRIRPLLVAGCAAAAAGVCSLVLKDLIGRPRPDAGLALVQAAGSSMPSTDAALVAGLTAAFVVAAPWTRAGARRTAVAVAVAANALVGTALVYLGAHWATDVLAGWALGAAVGLAVGRLARRRPAAGPVTDRSSVPGGAS